MDIKSILQYLPMLEVLCFNLFVTNSCCHRKYSAWKTFLMLFLFSAVMLTFGIAISTEKFFDGSGRFNIFSFIYLLPLNMLYREKLSHLFTLLCASWIYTMGVVSLTVQITGLFSIETLPWILFVESILFAITILPFNKWIIPKYIFIIDNANFYEKQWYKYIVLNNGSQFLYLTLLHCIFMEETVSVVRILALLLILCSIYISHFILYEVVLDSIRISQLKQISSHDALTGLGNRAQLENHLHPLTASDRVFSILFMDLDRFKPINDQYGHNVGDQYLKHFADVSARILGDSGKIYRFGGDEFVAIYYGVLPKKKLRELEELRDWDSGTPPAPFNGVSIGTLICHPPHKQADQILQQADAVMYQNKLKKKYERT